MTAVTAGEEDGAWSDSPVQVAGFVAGLALCSVSLSSGFIWICGATCVTDPIVWTPERRLPLSFLASFSVWWGYLVAHKAVTGRFIDPGNDGDAEGAEDTTSAGTASWLSFGKVTASFRSVVPPGPLRKAGFCFGVASLVSGIVVGFVYIRQGNHLLTNVGGALFLGGYVVAHYAETNKPL